MPEVRFDLEAYLDRIGHKGDREPRFSNLASLHLEHLAAIPFENLDVRLGRPGGLDLPSLQAKLVGRRRGGYCFEQNTLFAAALRTLGFEVATLEARVRPPGASAPLARTHMLLRVAIDGASWLADVGFGGNGPLLPVPLDGTASRQPDGTYRVAREPAGVRVLRRSWRGAWQDLYAFTLTPALPVDFELAHYYTSTHPRSVFVQTLTVQRSELEARHILRGRTYTLRHGEEETQREVAEGELPGLLAECFQLEIAAEEVLAALEGIGDANEVPERCQAHLAAPGVPGPRRSSGSVDRRRPT